jgi:hypothetical protein
MDLLFWLCWIAEFIMVCCWLANDMKHRRPNPLVYVSLAYMILVFQVRYGFECREAAYWMVFLPAMAMLLPLCRLLIYVIKREKWN